MVALRAKRPGAVWRAASRDASPKRKSRPGAGFPSFHFTCCSSKIRSELAVFPTLPALLALTALTVRILLLLAGLLTAALLLAGLLTRVLVLLARVLVLVRHGDSLSLLITTPE